MNDLCQFSFFLIKRLNDGSIFIKTYIDKLLIERLEISHNL